MTAWQCLVTDNPVMADVLRPLRRVRSGGALSGGAKVVVGLVALIYLSFTASSVQYAQYVAPAAFLYVMLTVAILAVATALYGSLAGDREKKTLDLLLVAPVTSGQIVAAKLAKAVLPWLATVVTLGLPAVAIAVTRMVRGFDPWSGLGDFAVQMSAAIALTFGSGVLVAGMSLFLSSASRSMSSALSATILGLFLVYGVLAVLCGTVGGFFGDGQRVLLAAYHPYVALTAALYPSGAPWHLPPGSFVATSTLWQAGVGVWLVAATARNLERERKVGSKPNA